MQANRVPEAVLGYRKSHRTRKTATPWVQNHVDRNGHRVDRNGHRVDRNDHRVDKGGHRNTNRDADSVTSGPRYRSNPSFI